MMLRVPVHCVSRILAVHLFILFVHQRETFASTPCAKFEFPDEVPGTNSVIVKKGPNATVYFRLNIADCPDHVKLSNFHIQVLFSPNGSAQNDLEICRLVHYKGKCNFVVGQGCKCPDDRGLYLVNVSREDYGDSVWIWRASSVNQRDQFMDSQLNVTHNVTADAGNQALETTGGESEAVTTTAADPKPATISDLTGLIVIGIVTALVLFVIGLSVAIVVTVVKHTKSMIKNLWQQIESKRGGCE